MREKDFSMYDLEAIKPISYLEEPSLEAFSINETLDKTLAVIKQPFTSNTFLDEIDPINKVPRDYVVIRGIEITVPTGLKGNYLNYVKELENSVLSAMDIESRILQPHVFFLSKVLEDIESITASAIDTSGYKPLGVEGIVKKLNKHLENNRKKVKGLVKNHFKNNNEIVESSKVVVGINELLMGIEIDKIQKSILEITKLTSTLNDKVSESGITPSKNFKKALAKVTLLTAKEATFISTLYYNYMVVHTSYIKMKETIG